MARSESEKYDYEAKQLTLQIKENKTKYISGELNLVESLEETDKLYDAAIRIAEKTTANVVLQDSNLMQLQSSIARQCAKSYKPDTLVFDARSFTIKLKKLFSTISSVDIEDATGTSKSAYATVWQKIGEESLKNMHVTPTFNFIYGTFSPDPASPVKKKRRRIEKEKIAEATKPEKVNLDDNTEGKDQMISQTSRTLSYLMRILSRNNKTSLCFYEFVFDPSSFTRTIENIFTVSLLVQEGYVYIFPDEQNLPCIRVVGEEERKRRQLDPSGRMQSVISMSITEYEDIKKKFKLVKALIPPPRSQKTFE